MEPVAVLGVPIMLESLEMKDKLPLMIVNDYDFYRSTIFNLPCVIFHFKGKYLSIPRLVKHFETVRRHINGFVHCVLWLDYLPPARRDRLIENGIPFFVKNTMVFLPFVATQLEKQKEPTAAEIPDKFTTATQCVFLWLLYHAVQPRPIGLIMNDLELSYATVTRALGLFAQCGLLKTRGNGRTRTYPRIASIQFWENGKRFLETPVKKRLYIEDIKRLTGIETCMAGESALADRSMLRPPKRACRAIYKKDYDRIKPFEVMPEACEDSGDGVEIEVWKYRPDLFAGKKKNTAVCGGIDLFSLYVSLENRRNDPRIEGELERLIGAYFNECGD